VFDGVFKQTLGAFPGYLDTFETVVDSTKIQFTPNTSFFENTEDWAVALQDIFAGDDAKARLDGLAASCTQKANA
jgi:multiple sugar transport system substrate-binding protein